MTKAVPDATTTVPKPTKTATAPQQPVAATLPPKQDQPQTLPKDNQITGQTGKAVPETPPKVTSPLLFKLLEFISKFINKLTRRS